MVLDLDRNNFDDIINTRGMVVVDFWADWCAPCKRMLPIFDELSKEFGDRMLFGKVNIVNEEEIAYRFGVMSIPTFLVFEGGVKIGEFHNAMSLEDFREMLKDFV